MNFLGPKTDPVGDALSATLTAADVIINRFPYAEKAAGLNTIPEKRQLLRTVRSVLACFRGRLPFSLFVGPRVTVVAGPVHMARIECDTPAHFLETIKECRWQARRNGVRIIGTTDVDFSSLHELALALFDESMCVCSQLPCP